MEIKTPEQYEQFRSGPYQDQWDVILVDKSANARRSDFGQDYLAYARYTAVYLQYPDDSTIIVMPFEKKVAALLRNGSPLLANLPQHYLEYSIELEGDVDITTADIDAIVNWTRATKIEILGNGDIALPLSHRVHEMKSFDVAQLELCVQKSSYKELLLNPFLEGSPVKRAIFYGAEDMTEEEFDEFVSQQTIEGFGSYRNGEKITYYRRN